jgi:chemosensory pili system protein ChpE/L-lysine exporter family protein LysE/ArgO
VFSLFLSALLVGLVFNAAPGAVFAETLKQGLRGGFRSALSVQLGSLAGDALWAVLGLVGVGLLLQLEYLRLPIGIAGAIYLLYLAWEAWTEASQEIRLEPSSQQTNKALRSGMMLSITNPQNVAYWAALGSAMGAVGVTSPEPSHYSMFFAGFMVASILWSFVCAGFIHIFVKAGLGQWVSLTYRACALAFLLLALSSAKNLWQSQVHFVKTMPAIHGKP